MNAFDFLQGLKPIVFSGSEFEVSEYGAANSEMVLTPSIEYGVENQMNFTKGFEGIPLNQGDRIKFNARVSISRMM